jgi:hypothetical protein
MIRWWAAAHEGLLHYNHLLTLPQGQGTALIHDSRLETITRWVMIAPNLISFASRVLSTD